ncbi:MAG: nitroreductase family protein [Chloroflexota bacterium]
MPNPVLQNIKTRRVCRDMTDERVTREQLAQILEAGRWAPAGGNQRSNRYVAITNSELLRLLGMAAPGMYQKPQAIILLCIDWAKVAEYQFAETDMVPYVDLGTTMQTMMLAAHGIGLGSGPVTSFSKTAVKVILNMPEHLSPEIMLCVGHPAPRTKRFAKSSKKVTWQSLTEWERFD